MEVSLEDLASFDETLGDKLKKQPTEHLPLVSNKYIIFQVYYISAHELKIITATCEIDKNKRKPKYKAATKLTQFASTNIYNTLAVNGLIFTLNYSTGFF